MEHKFVPAQSGTQEEPQPTKTSSGTMLPAANPSQLAPVGGAPLAVAIQGRSGPGLI